MSVGGIGELGLLERIKPYLALGAGNDDAAVIADASGFVVASCDTFVEGVHFDFGWMGSEDVGWRSVALALGDLAAKGATPLWSLASVAIPSDWPINRLIGLYAGMEKIGRSYGLGIVGGDLSSIEGPAVITLTVVGRTLKSPLSRALAEPGWSVGVTGPLGAAAVALRERRPLRIEPLIEVGRRLNELTLSCGDISDGLAREMEKFLAMSGAGCVLNALDIPRADGASIEDALTSGEEAALVCVGPQDAIAQAGLHVVGRMTEDKRVVIAGANLKSSGFDHFA